MKLPNFVKPLFLVLCMLLLTGTAFAQRTISGTVHDQQGEPVPFATVAVPGSTTGATTDFDGRFSLNVPAGATSIQISFIGFKRQTIELGSNVTFNIVLESESTHLDEVVVVGYGTVARRDLTGSVSSVSGAQLAAIPVASAAEAMTGRMAGVQVSATEGSPDAEITIRVRGGGSITSSNEPLYIVDGFPVSSINDIPSADIASIDVLKDASSTAIYGARGANGVIIITTKGGSEGKITVSYNAYTGVKKIAKRVESLDSYDYALWNYEHSLMSGNGRYETYFGNWQDIDMYKDMAYNDWLDIIFGNVGTQTNHNLSVSGGTDKTKYAVSFNRLSDKAIVTGSDFSRNNLSLKLTNNPHKRLQLDFQTRWAETRQNGPSVNDGGDERGSSTEGRMRNVMLYPPIPLTAPALTDPSETDPDFNLYSPSVSIRDNERVNTRATLNMGASVTWEFIDNFKFKTELGMDRFSEQNDRFYGVSTYYARVNVPGDENKGKPAVIFTDRSRESFRNTNTLQMNLKDWMPNGHNLSAVIGQEYLITTQQVMQTIVGGFDPSFNLDMARRLTTEGNAADNSNVFAPDDKLFSFFGRANYDYQSKYLISATFRADGSSKFARGNRWGYFPSMSAAWRVSGENFMKPTENWLYDLKLRVSYGTVGNNNIPGGQMAQAFISRSTTWVHGFTSYWAPENVLANPNLTWETTVTKNMGIDWGLFGGKLSGTIDGYINNTRDLLLRFPLVDSYSAQYRNMGETQNSGIELSADWFAVDKRHWGITFGANIGFNKNKVVSLGDMDDFSASTGWASTDIQNDYWVAVGQSLGLIYGYRSLGRYEVDDFQWNGTSATAPWGDLKDGVIDGRAVVGGLRPGTMKVGGKDGQMVVPLNSEGTQLIGNAMPKHTGGFYVTARAYGFDFAANFNWSYGNDIYNANKIEWNTAGRHFLRNLTTDMAQGTRWTNLDMNTGELIFDPDALAAANANTTMWSPSMQRFVLTDWAIEDGSFLRLNTLTLGYTVPKNLTQRAMIQSCRLYVTGYNVWLWTNYSGFDPEVNTRRNLPYTPGVDFSAYPRSRQIVFGVNLTF
ncbi:MAG: TonB-dependent receptor [Bacteroidales bacterium]|nr:TonB-dependent receptor [Bacteroidales bacterium]